MNSFSVALCAAVWAYGSLVWIAPVVAAPLITNARISGTAIAIDGSGFGIKVGASPVKFDDFENGIAQTALNDRDASWNIYWGTKGYGVNYSNTYAHSGSLSVSSLIAGGESFKTNYFTYAPGSREMFISYWWRTVRGDAADTTIIKMTRICSSEAAGGGGVYNGDGNTSLGGTYNLGGGSGPYCAYNNGVTSEVVLKYFKAPPLNAWVKVEMYKKLSTPGANDGIMECNLLGIDYAIDTAAMTRAAGKSFLLNTVLLGTMDGSDKTHDYEIYIDDVYIDSTRARVEIGNSATWSGCTIRETQLPVSWSDTVISSTIKPGLFTIAQPKYVYVVDAKGAVNQTGYPLATGTLIASVSPTRRESDFREIVLRTCGTGRMELHFEQLQQGDLSVSLVSASGKTVWEYTAKESPRGRYALGKIAGSPGCYIAVFKCNNRSSVYRITLVR